MSSQAIIIAMMASILVVLESLVLTGCGKSPTSQHKEVERGVYASNPN